MKRYTAIIICVLTCITACASQAALWQKFVSADKSYSLHYPNGWKAIKRLGAVDIRNPANSEMLLIITIAENATGTPHQIADFAVKTLKQDNPDMKSFGFRDEPEMSMFQLTFTDKGKANQGDVLVVKSGGAAFWFSFTGQAKGYDRVRALNILQGVVSSLAEGTGSKPPADSLLAPSAPTTPDAGKLTAADKAKTKKNADAFMFVLEFGLGTPLTAGQEKIILTELLKGWAQQTPEDLAKYDLYPTLVKAIMNGDKNKVEEFRKTTEATMREWLAETDQTDPAVKIVRNQLNASSKTLAEGNPPLSEMAASAYSEMMAYSVVLKKNPKATPDQLSAAVVAQYKSKIIKAWPGLSAEGKSDACTMPGVWMTIRQLIRAGTPAEQKSARATLAKVGGSQQTASAGSAGSSGKGSSPVKNMIRHNVMMNIQQQTFNSYMWSRGYSGWTPSGKMW